MTENSIDSTQGDLLSDVPQPSKATQESFNNLQEQHNNLIVILEHDRRSVDIDTVRQFLNALSAAGTHVSDSDSRSRLRGYIRFWASFVHDQTGEYPVLNLRPSEYLVQRHSRPEQAGILSDGNRIGQIIDGYQLIEKIGRGGFSTVYLAQEIQTGNQFAIKLFEKRELADQLFTDMLKSEAIASHLQHPNILEIRKFGIFDNTSYLVTDYIAAGSLAERLSQYYWRPQLLEVLSIFKQIASALNYLQQQGVVHRDVKPGNILIDYENRCYLSDFGVATLIEKLYGSTIVVGTPEYMAPEIIRSPELATGKTDIYSFGVVMYQILNGQLPFEGNSAKKFMQAHLQEQPLPMGAEVPRQVAELVELCLSKDPEDRISANLLYAMIVELESTLSKDDLKRRITGFTSSVEKRHQIAHADAHDTERVFERESIPLTIRPLRQEDTELRTPGGLFFERFSLDKSNYNSARVSNADEQQLQIVHTLPSASNQDDDPNGQDEQQLPKALLIPLTGQDRGKLIPLRDRTVIGSSTLCSIALNDQTVSPQHLLLVPVVEDDEPLWRAYDLASNTGTKINNEEITAGYVEHNNEISIGMSRFIFKRLDQ
jgi:serine/threonine protein kinase